MIPEVALNVLLADNPWLEGDDATRWMRKFLPETYIERTQRIALDDRVALVIGPRQAGKSTLIWKTVSTLGRPCLFVNCEERAFREWARSPALFVRDLKQLIPRDAIVFLEEVQHLEDAGLFLKGVIDRKSGFRFVATGSSSFELESKTRESLAGRANRHLLLPFSLKETTSTGSGPAALEERRVQKALLQLLVHGGYPTVHLGEKKETVLTGLVESFILRDASDRFRIRHTEAFRKLLALMASQIGNLCNFTDWASNTGISADTAREYATILSDAHVIRFVRPFVGGKRAEITSTAKVYFVDNGIRNRVFGGFEAFRNRPDRGALLENFVFTELAKTIHPLLDNIRFWRSKSGAEVDFVVDYAGQRIGIEVKAGNARGKLTRSAHSFIDAYAPTQFWVISDREHERFAKNNCQVIFMTASQLERALRGMVSLTP